MTVDFIEGDWIYDIETYPNCFTFCAVYGNGSSMRVFEISDRKDESDLLLDFFRKLKKHNHRLVGFNNLGFDYPVIHFILEKAKKAKSKGKPLVVTSSEIYDVAMDIIKTQSDDKFGKSIKTADVIVPQVDLYKIHHFDNKAKATSLKMLEFNMLSENIEDLPFPVGTHLTSDQIDVLIQYNKHDVNETLKFYYHSLEAIRFREGLSIKYGFDCTNFNDTKIGKEYFIRRLEKEVPGSCYTKGKYGRKINQTKRERIRLRDVILPYIQFERPECNALLTWFKSQVITETKGVFSDLRECDIGDVAKYTQLTRKRKKLKEQPSEQEINDIMLDNPKAWIEEVALKSGKNKKSYWLNWNVVETMNIVMGGLRIDFGTGGLHASVENSIIESDNDYMIIDVDVSSMYPNLAISNRLYPKHLTDKFCDIYKDVYEERKKYPKGSPENAVMKLALNGTYGESNNQYSPLYDPQFTMGITIGGQLSLTMLVEQMLKIPECQLIAVNTDGLTVKIPRRYEQMHKDFCTEWERITKLDLEYAYYSKMFIRDVNSYIAMYQGDKEPKRKGIYEYKDLGWHQNHSAKVVAMAVEAELVKGVHAHDFILNHKNKWDFMLRTKVPRSSRLIIVKEDGEEILQQNICRYYPSKIGGKLIKIMPPLEGKEEGGERRLGIDVEWNVKTCNDITEFNWDINYDYYFNEADKLIDIFYKEKE